MSAERVTDEAVKAIELLRVAVCPMKASGCDGTHYPVQPYGEGEQCQFCYERNEVLSAADAVRDGSASGAVDALNTVMREVETIWAVATPSVDLETMGQLMNAKARLNAAIAALRQPVTLRPIGFIDPSFPVLAVPGGCVLSSNVTTLRDQRFPYTCPVYAGPIVPVTGSEGAMV